MSVVGIDFGNLNTVVAVARNRGIDVIVNEVSNRATPSLVSFGEKQRYLGEAAKTQEVSNFKNTVSSLKRLIGLSFNDKDIEDYEKRFVNCNLVNLDDKVGVSVNFRNDQTEFSFIQLAAMYFNMVKEFTEKEIKIPVTNAVISVPQWFTDHQRRAVMDAAEIANINCLRVLTDTTAIALGYGITKLDLPDLVANPEAKPKTVCFVDMGSSSYQVSIVSFIKGKLVVKGTACDRHLGGRNFDEVLQKHFIVEFSKKYRIDIASNKKAMFRLTQACEKVKKILSANAVTMLNVECLMDDKDVSSQISRTEFEEWAVPLLPRVTTPLEKALAFSGLSISDIDSVELTGGSTRIPMVRDAISNFFNIKALTTLNQDEAVARGCALQCAILSPVFKVRDFSIQDWNPYPIILSWDPSLLIPSKDGSVDAAMNAFPLGNSMPSTKALTLTRRLDEEELSANKNSIDISLAGTYTDEIYQHGASVGNGLYLGKWTVKGIKKHTLSSGESALESSEGKAAIKIKAKLDANGIVEIESAQQLVDVLVPVPVEEKKETPVIPKEEKNKENKNDKKNKNDGKKDSATSLSSESIQEDQKMKKVTRKHDLIVISETSSLPKEKIAALQSIEGELYSNDRLIIDTAEKKNALEEYVYETRSKLEMQWSDFVIDSDQTSFVAALNEAENWLYSEEGEIATKSVYVEKLNQLKKHGDPITLRAREFESRPFSEKTLREYINNVLIDTIAEDDRYDHISKEDIEKVRKECTSKLEWLNDMVSKQNDLPKHADVVVTSDEILKTKEKLYHFVNPILSKSKPAAPKETKPTDEEMKDSTPSTETPKKEEENDMNLD